MLILKTEILICFLCTIFLSAMSAQDLSLGYIANDLSPHPMQLQSKPAYLDSIVDNSFPNTTIRRITNAGTGNIIAPIYSTIQAWNANESLMLVYTSGTHQLLNGSDYTFIRLLSDINPADIELLFWHFTDPEILFYFESGTENFVSYNINTQVKTTVVNLATLSNCDSGTAMGNDIQMMSWDSDIFCFRCGNSSAFYYRISTNNLTQFNITNINYTAPMSFPSGNLFFHQGNIYDTDGNFVRALNVETGYEHSCLGKLSNGDDAYFAIAFEEGPDSGCQGTLVAHNATNGNCFSVTQTIDYDYPQTGTHISSLAHKNTNGAWVAVSMIGYEEDGQGLLDQEIFIAKVNVNNADVYRVAHHRSDENEFDYFGEPHVTISPKGTRLLFGSDWSGPEDGQSIDCYVAELNVYTSPTGNSTIDAGIDCIEVFPNPVSNFFTVSGSLTNYNIQLLNIQGQVIEEHTNLSGDFIFDTNTLSNGLFYIRVQNINDPSICIQKIIKE